MRGGGSCPPGSGRTTITAASPFLHKSTNATRTWSLTSASPGAGDLPLWLRSARRGVDLLRVDPVDLCRAAGYVDRVLKGAKAAELPMQAPVKFDLLINLKTANALALSIPQTPLATADDIIE